MSRQALLAVYFFFFFMYFFGFGLMGNMNSNVPYPWEEMLKPLQLSRYCYTILISVLAHFAVFRKFYHRRPIWKLLLAISILLAFYIGLRYLIEEVIFPTTLGYRNYSPVITIRYYIVDNIYFGLIIIFIGFVLYLFDELFHQLRQQRRLREANKISELNFLEAQMNPHFLFNSLNNIYSLALASHPKTATAILKLSEMMRYVTYRKEKLVQFSDEINYTESLVDIHQLRQDHKLQVEWNIPATAMTISIPPLLLVPLIENALKHGDLSDPLVPLIITAQPGNSLLTLTVQNKIGPTAKKPGGVGLENLKRRLELLYENKQYECITEQRGDQFYSIIKIPVK